MGVVTVGRDMEDNWTPQKTSFVVILPKIHSDVLSSSGLIVLSKKSVPMVSRNSGQNALQVLGATVIYGSNVHHQLLCQASAMYGDYKLGSSHVLALWPAPVNSLAVHVVSRKWLITSASYCESTFLDAKCSPQAQSHTLRVLWAPFGRVLNYSGPG